MQIIKNIINKDLQDSIEEAVKASTFPWAYNPGTVYQGDLDEDDLKYILEEGYNPQQFVHDVVYQSKCISSYFQLIAPIIQEASSVVKADIEIKKAKFNLLVKDSNAIYHFPHTDTNNVDPDVKTLIYYVSDADGDTYMFNERAPLIERKVTVNKRITPTKGTAVIFDSDVFHSSSSPIDSNIRLVLNVVFRILK